MMREGDVANSALLLIDHDQEVKLAAELKTTPAVAGAGFKRAVLQSFRDVMAANMSVSIFINLIFAGIIAFGVVYNAARVSLSERSRELASLRVLGFTRAEISLILMGELALRHPRRPAGRGSLRIRSVCGHRRHRSTVRSIASRCTSHARQWRCRSSASSPQRSSRDWSSGESSITWIWSRS